MKASLAWLNEFLPEALTASVAAERLRRAGFDVPSVTRVGGIVTNVVVARVEAVEKHPNADKLRVCRVFDGKDRWNVVCGAPNVVAGGVYPLARLGATLPGDLKIEARALRGVDSQGMMCSARELGLSEEHAGLFELPADAPLGESIVAALGLDDEILEVEITPNRPDALSHWGLARELAAAGGRPLDWKPPRLPKAPVRKDAVRIEEAAACSRYIGRLLEGVRVGPSPLWLRLRLERCGLRSINNVVDVTNYVLLELGHPLHAFDRAKLSEARVVVRRGRAGETLEALDGVVRPVDGALVVADGAVPQALAGVMGGRPSSVTAETTALFLESAVFLPAEIRRARGRWNLSTESSYRFERGTDPTMAEAASRRAVQLILETGGGRLTGECDSTPRPVKSVSLKISVQRISNLLGLPVTPAQAKKALGALGFKAGGSGDRLTLVPPVHRADVRETADVAEEVARLVGYDHLPERRRAASRVIDHRLPARELAGRAAARWTGWGFQEARNSGLVSRADWNDWGGDGGALVELANPLSTAGDCLNPTLLINLLANARHNRRRGAANVRLFENARIFEMANGAAKENDATAWVAVGESEDPHWKFRPRSLSFWDAKAWTKALLKEWRLKGVRFEPGTHPSFHPGESQTVVLNGRPLGVFGRLHPRRAAAWDLPPDTMAGELNLTVATTGEFLPVKFGGLSNQPALIRDFSLIFPSTVTWSSVVFWIHGQSDSVESVRLFDVFTGAGVPEGQRSLAFRVSFRHADRTLSDAEGAALHERVLKGLADTFHAQPRAAAPPAP